MKEVHLVLTPVPMVYAHPRTQSEGVKRCRGEVFWQQPEFRGSVEWREID